MSYAGTVYLRMIIFLFLLAVPLYFALILREVYSIILELSGCGIQVETLCPCLCWVCQAKQNSFNKEKKKNKSS